MAKAVMSATTLHIVTQAFQGQHHISIQPEMQAISTSLWPEVFEIVVTVHLPLKANTIRRLIVQYGLVDSMHHRYAFDSTWYTNQLVFSTDQPPPRQALRAFALQMQPLRLLQHEKREQKWEQEVTALRVYHRQRLNQARLQGTGIVVAIILSLWCAWQFCC